MMRRSKFNNQPSDYRGVTYHSQAEARYAQQLDLRLKGNDIAAWTRQVPFPLLINDHKIGVYVIDFCLTHNDKSLEYVEIKGIHTAVFTLKLKLFKALYPHLRYTLIDSKNV